jgi:hypothetical protein
VLLKHGADPRARDGKYCGTPAGWGAFAGHTTTANRILEANVDIFDAIDFDRADRIVAILDHDAAAIDRPFNAYASCPSQEGQWWPTPECTPFAWATARGKANAIRALSELGADARTSDRIARAERVATFLQTACWDEHVHGKRDHRRCDRTAQRLLAHDPAIARDSIYTAVVCGDIEEVTRILAAQPEVARTRGGSRAWTPILYLAYTRFTHAPTLEHAVSIADLLLDHGADPNDFYMAGRRALRRAGGRGRRGRAGFAATAVCGGAVRAAARTRRGAVRCAGAVQHAFQRRHALVARARLQAHHRHATSVSVE